MIYIPGIDKEGIWSRLVGAGVVNLDITWLPAAAATGPKNSHSHIKSTATASASKAHFGWSDS